MKTEHNFDDTAFDMIVVGSEGAGLTAAFTAAMRGLSVLLVEKAPRFGGTTARSDGGLWIPGNPTMAQAGYADSRERAETYLKGGMGAFYDAEKTGAFLDDGPQMVRFLHEHSEVRLDNWQSPDYEPWREGAAHGRSIGVTSFDGRRLGRDLDAISPPLPQLTILGGMQVGYGDVPRFAKVLRGASDFVYTGEKVARYAYDRVVHHRLTRMVLGNALIGALLLSARKAGVTLWRDCPMTQLVEDEGAIVGVKVRRGEHEHTLTARRAVVLATGGYGGNPQMRRRYLPLAEAGYSLQPESNTGDGLSAGEKAGGHVVEDNCANAIWAPFSSTLDAENRLVHYPHNVRDRSFPGFLMVDEHARRFVNEGASYQALGNLFNARRLTRCWLICDHKALRRYGMGHVKPWPLPYKAHIRSGYLRGGRTIVELARRLDLDPETLRATVERFNHFARSGQDPDFHKGEDEYSADQGDPEVT
ncbi:MAG: FAD-dependent oxidoreductase, partial [Pseudomonadota bacterium]|nr:FAD-dependent oxidoreductase [Pseudomonadota bacterium]